MIARTARTTPAMPPPANFFIAAGAVAVAGVAADVGELVLLAVEAEFDDEVVELTAALDVCDGCVNVVDAADAVVANTERLLRPVLTSQIRYVKGAGSVESVA